MPKIKFLPFEVEIESEPGETLLRAAISAGLVLNSSCGGVGSCGKCKVRVDSGKVKAPNSAKLTEDEKKNGYVLGCLAVAEGDAVITVPEETLAIGGTEEERQALTRHLLSAKGFEERLPSFQLDPPVAKLPLTMTPPDLTDSVADWERVKRELKKSGLEPCVDLNLIRELPDILREAGWEPLVTIDKGDSDRLIRVEAGEAASKHYGVAIDIGTTTVVAELLDLNSGKVVAAVSDYNKQISYGDDVITRIVHSLKGEGLNELQKAVVDTINGLLERLEEKTMIAPQEVDLIYAAGNTVMTHLLLGITPRHIREAPYIPGISFPPSIKAREVGIEAGSHTVLKLYPCMASWVGGDIVAGLLAAGVTDRETLTLYIDVGTNGEMVLGSSDWMLSCSCSAGPAFEGGGVKHGMRASPGAVELIRINPQTHEPSVLTLGGKRAKGICGSGLIEGIAELFLAGVLEANGKFCQHLENPRVRKGDSGHEYLLIEKEQTSLSTDLVLTEVDIDNLIRAKGAIFAGMNVLLDSVGLSVEAIDEVLIAGAFGNFLDIDRAIAIGLLPDLPRDKFSFVGNGSLLGARLACLSLGMEKKAEDIAQKLTYLDLSAHPGYMDKYVSALFLPHTDAGLFPTVKPHHIGA